MHDDRDQDRLEPELAQDLSALTSHPHPPAAAEDRVVSALRARGLLSTGRAGSRRLRAAAAALLIFAAGAALGSLATAPPTAPEEQPTHALFLLGGIEPGSDEAALVEEYRSWAIQLARQGKLTAGEKLAPTAWLLSPGADQLAIEGEPAAHVAAPVSGFFLLTVGDTAAALEIARSCPHLRHGGRVLLRQIDPV